MQSSRRVLVIAAALAPAALTATAAAPATAAPPATKRGADQLFAYRRGPIAVQEHGVEDRDGVLVRDITYTARGGDPVRAYLVEPAGGGRHAATLYLHWFEPPNPLSSRLEFLDEAVELARQGMVALLPDLTFPWSIEVFGDRRDLDNVVAQTIRVRQGLDLLTTRPNVDRRRVAVVGHDYGGMYGLIVAHLDRQRIDAVVAMNVDATFSNWFARFFLGLEGDATIAYEALIEPVDPIRFLDERGGSAALFQFSEPDFFVPDSTRRAIVSQAARPKDYRLYAGAEHQLDERARAERTAWLADHLRL